MNEWPLVALGDVFEIGRGGSPRPIDAYLTADPTGVNWIMISDATDSSKYITHTKKRIRREGVKRSREVKPGDFLLTNSMSFGKPYIMRTSGCIHDGWLVLSPRRNDVNADFFYHLLSSKSVYSEFERRAAGATVKNLNIDLVNGVEVRLPSMPEQLRIAEILDKADGLRAKCRAALTQLDTLTHSIFLDLFGDPGTNPKHWDSVCLKDVLSMSLRNGLSPSHSGKVTAKVLTLTAITGSRFNEGAWKLSTFQSVPPAVQAVDENDFLICRGNGNIRLVGKGHFPIKPMPDVTFPDTMIAARVNEKRIDRLFLEQIWNSTAIRGQLESSARTTNGTYKVNQSMLEGISFVCPPISLQREFAVLLAAVEKVRSAHTSSLIEMEALFISLQDHAFRGEL